MKVTVMVDVFVRRARGGELERQVSWYTKEEETRVGALVKQLRDLVRKHDEAGFVGGGPTQEEIDRMAEVAGG